MKMNNERPFSRRNDPKARGCCSLFLGILLIGIIAVIVVFVNNNRPPDIVIPTPAMPAVNAYNDFVIAGQMAGGMQHKTPYDAPPQQRQQEQSAAYMAAFHKDAAPVLAVLRQGLAKPYLNPPDRSISFMGFRQFASFRELARIIDGEAMYYDHSGQPGRAANVLLDGMEMAVMIPHGGGLIAGLVGIACETICISRLEPLLPRLSPTELAVVAARLDRIESKRVPFADIIQEEGNIMAAYYLEALRSPKGGLRTFQGARALIDTEHGAAPSLQQWKQIIGFYLSNKTAILRTNLAYFHALAAESRRPFTGRSHVRPPNNLYAQQMTYLTDVRGRFVGMIAITELLRAEVALYRCHAANGRYPDALAQLVPTYLNAIPDDPFGGGANIPLCYRVTKGGQGFLLYSLGPDRRDDGGTPVPFPRDTPGDIVAGQLWPSRSTPKHK